MRQLINSQNRIFIYSISFVLFLIMVMAIINNRFQSVDFEVYYYAAKALNNNSPVYGEVFGSSTVGYYKYSPTVLLLYVPAALLPFKVAAVLNYLIISVSIIWCVILVSQYIQKTFFSPNCIKPNLILFLLFGLSITFMNRDLILGNVNIVLLAIIVFTFTYKDKLHPIFRAALLALPMLFKPYLIILLLPLLVGRKWKLLLQIGLSGIILASLPFLFLGITKSIELYTQWFDEMLRHRDYIHSPFTFDSLFKSYIAPSLETNLNFIILAILTCGYMIFRLGKQIRTRRLIEENTLYLDIFTFLALIPNLFITDTQQLLYCMPLQAFFIIFVILKKNKFLWAYFVVIMFFYVVDQPDLLGRDLAKTFYDMGIAGLANIIIIISVRIFYINLNNTGIKYRDSLAL